MLRTISVLAIGLWAAGASADVIKAPAPAFTLQSRDGGSVSLADFKGQVVMVNFWATWCVPCRQEMPHLEALYEKYKGLGFTLVGVNVEDNPAGAQKWLKENGPVTFPVLFDPKSQVSKLYNVVAMPTTVIVARDGSMRFVHHAYKAGTENDYANEVRALLRE
jgi:peroxiredoxin